MRAAAILVISLCGAALVLILLTVTRNRRNDSSPDVIDVMGAGELHRPDKHVSDPDCANIAWTSEDTELYRGSVAVFYDFSTMSPESLQLDLNNLVTKLNQDLISQILLIQNSCENEATVKAAVAAAQQHANMQIILLDTNKEKVSRSRARIEAVDRVKSPFMLFISSDTVPTSKYFIESMLLSLSESPNKVIVPSRKAKHIHVDRLTWALNIKSEEHVSTERTKHLDVPLVDNTVFMLRSDLYESVGGFDKFFYKHDGADSIAFSLAVWSCGGSISLSTCTYVRRKPTSVYENAIVHLQHAKYIQEVFGGTLQSHITYPGIEFYQTAAYDKQSIASRQKMFRDRGCMTIEWYSQHFHQTLPKKTESSKFFNPDYHPVLPIYRANHPEEGRWFVLFAGRCMKVDTDSVLGMVWCPQDLTSEYRFTWHTDGYVKCKEKCVAVRSSDKTLVLEECKKVEDNSSQLFIYNKTDKSIKSRHSSECVTHVNGAEGRQILQLMECKKNSLFTQFVLNDEY